LIPQTIGEWLEKHQELVEVSDCLLETND